MKNRHWMGPTPRWIIRSCLCDNASAPWAWAGVDSGSRTKMLEPTKMLEYIYIYIYILEYIYIVKIAFIIARKEIM